MQTKTKTTVNWSNLFGTIGEAIFDAGYELGGDGLLHPTGEMFDDSPEPALEPELIASRIGFGPALIRAWAKWEVQRRGW